MSKKKYIDCIQSKLSELTPEADYHEIYNQMLNSKELFLELAILLVKEVHPMALAGAVIGNVFQQFKGDEKKIREAVFALINVSNVNIESFEDD